MELRLIFLVLASSYLVQVNMRSWLQHEESKDETETDPWRTLQKILEASRAEEKRVGQVKEEAG